MPRAGWVVIGIVVVAVAIAATMILVTP